MNPNVQKKLEEYFEDPNNFPYQINEGLNYAMSVTDSQTGYLVGVIGQVGKKQANRLLNHATAPHVPGSTLKPIALYAPLIDEGIINWATVFDDVPVSFYEREGEYREYPKNSPDVYDGLITVKDAIRNSKNTVAVRLSSIRTPKRIYNSLRDDFGFTTLVEGKSGTTDIATAPMALGQLSCGVPIRKMTESFSVFSGEGEWRQALSYLYLVDYKGKTVMEKEQGKKNIYKKSTAQIMNKLLMTVTEDGTAAKITLKNWVNTAGKTGTSGGSRDKSFIGYTPYYTAGIWCGYDSERAVGGLSRSHLEIWDDVMREVHIRRLKSEATVKRFSREGLVEMSFCMDSGGRYSDVCRYDPRGSRRDVAYFTYDNCPTDNCECHVLCLYDTVSKGISLGNCPSHDLVAVSLLRIDGRSFPKEVYVTDAEYVYRDVPEIYTLENDPTKPYFYPAIPEGEYVGISNRKRQFNCACELH
jgi:penicillin-binding protein 1A